MIAGIGQRAIGNELRDRADACRARRITGLRLALPGPTGEDDSLRFTARGLIAGVADTPAAVLQQAMAALASGNRLLLADTPAARTIVAARPAGIGSALALEADWFERPIGALLFDGDDYIGRPVNLAARLCDEAGPGELLAHPSALNGVPEWVRIGSPRIVSVRGVGTIEGVSPLRPSGDVQFPPEPQWDAEL